MSTSPKPSAKFKHTWMGIKVMAFPFGLQTVEAPLEHFLIIVTVLRKCLLRSPQLSSRKCMYCLPRQIRLFPPDNYTETHLHSQFVYLHPIPPSSENINIEVRRKVLTQHCFPLLSFHYSQRIWTFHWRLHDVHTWVPLKCQVCCRCFFKIPLEK